MCMRLKIVIKVRSVEPFPTFAPNTHKPFIYIPQKKNHNSWVSSDNKLAIPLVPRQLMYNIYPFDCPL